MSQKSSAPPTQAPAEKLVRDIRRATRKYQSAEGKIRIVVEGHGFEEGIEILKNRSQRVSLSRFPFLRQHACRKHALSPGWAAKFPSIRVLFARNLDGAGAEWSGFFSPNRGILSKA